MVIKFYYVLVVVALALLCCGSLLSLSLRSLILASLAYALLVGSSLVLLSGSLLVSLLYLALLHALSDSCAACRKYSVYRILSVVVSGDYVVDVFGVRVGVNDSEKRGYPDG